MFQNYFRTAWRNLLRNRSYSAVNILGLAIGMAVALLIGLWVQYQYSYDRWLPGYKQVAQVRMRFIRNGETVQVMGTPLPLTEALRNEVSGIKWAAHTDWMGTHGLVSGEHKIYLIGALAEEDFCRVFPYQAVKGDVNQALKRPSSIVLTESTCKALFGSEEPMGKKVRVDNQQDFFVGAVIRDLPSNSSFNLHYILPFSYHIQTNDWVREAITNWNQNSFQTFVSIEPNTSYAQVEAKMRVVAEKYNPKFFKEGKLEFFLQPMSHWHLYSDFKNGRESGGFIEYVRLFSIIGVLVLLIACINFMNLSTARSEKRAREVGVRKAIGSLRRDLILQFLVESMLITTIAAVFSLVLVEIALPSFNLLTQCPIDIPWRSAVFWEIMVGYVIITGLLAGSRPAFYLSSFKPVKVLKGKIHTGRAAALPRKLLVVLQFTCSIALIISTLLIYQQIQYAKDRPNGYDANRLVATDGSIDLSRNYAALKNDLLQTQLVDRVTKASSEVTTIWNWSGVLDWSGRYPNEELTVAHIDIMEDYFQTVGMPIVAGTNFSGNLAADSSKIIINEAAAKRMRLADPINQMISWSHNRRVKVIGVVRDALMISPFSPAEPTFFAYSPSDANNIMYRLSKSADVHAAMAKLTPIFNKYNPSYPFIYHFIDESYAEKFDLEVLVGRLAGIFAALAIFISCLGLFGLAAYLAEQRVREIGIRKVLGASVSQLWYLLSKDFIVLVAISCVVASPLAFYFLHGWLQKYQYRITIGPGVFFQAGVLAMVITVATISFQAIRGAMTNPTGSLRSE
ncbi:MAG TPA: ABC transporter permease [Puia sp.]|nr:ABC transporter permease [Puia sp.]